MTEQAYMVEQRKEDREPAAGEVRFVLEGGGSSGFEGRLLDHSRSGFRASHAHAALPTGQRVRFRHSLAEGSAIVMWNRIVARHVESGFLILK